MALLLNIDTATSVASVGFSRDGVLAGMRVNDTQKEHASFLQPAIDALVREGDISLDAIDAVAVTIGPGSYTGLRVGLASAKGIAYALGKPVVPVVTLEVMAHAAEKAWQHDVDTAQQRDADPAAPDKENQGRSDAGLPPLFCPMIDARRDEVFAAVYAPGGNVVMEPRALILSEAVFEPYILNNLLIFSGDGSFKWKSGYLHSSARFLIVQHSVADLAVVAEKHLRGGTLEALAYLHPLYLKEFHKNS